MIKPEDIKPNAELLCIKLGSVVESAHFTVGRVYLLGKSEYTDSELYLTDDRDTEDYYIYSVDEFTGHLSTDGDVMPKFAPMAALTEEELFLFKLSGEIPERFVIP